MIRCITPPVGTPKAPREGNTYLDAETGQHYVYTNDAWHERPPEAEAAAEADEQARATLFYAVDTRIDKREEARRRLNREHGADLLLVRQQELWRYADVDSFDAYIASKRWSKSAAYQWMTAAAAADRLLRPDTTHPEAPLPPPAVTEDTLDRIGVSNLAQLGKALVDATPEEVPALVAQATELTTSDFRRVVAERAGKVESIRTEFLEDTALSLRDLCTALPVSPDARASLQTIASKAKAADNYLADLDSGWAVCRECGGVRNAAGTCTACGLVDAAAS